MPPEQTWPVPQLVLQVPQWLGSLCRSAQVPLQLVWTLEQAQLPLLQLWPPVQAWVQRPQLF